MKRALPYFAVVAVIGCGGATTAFTRTGPTLAAQPDGCEFSVVTASPEPSTELGTIDIRYEKQTDWIYDESAFKRKVRADVCRSGGDTVVAHINDNGLYMNARVLTTKAAPVKTPDTAVASSEPEASEPEATAPAAPPPAETATAPEKSAQTQAAATPAKKAEVAKADDPAKAASGKKRSKKGATAKKDEDIRGKDGKVDIDNLL